MKQISWILVIPFYVCTLLPESGLKENSRSMDVEPPNIFFAGLKVVEAEHSAVAQWKNGRLTLLTDGTTWGWANSVFAVGDNAYVSGSSNYRATYWKNGEAHSLSDGPYKASAESIYVVGNDVHIAGYEETSDGNSLAMYWKNGTAEVMTDGSSRASARSVYVSGGDIFIAGNIGFTATYWKNGTPVSLPDNGQEAYANSIFVLGNDVYVAGFDYKNGIRVATYWKNGVPVALTKGKKHSEARCIFVSGNDVYVGGFENSKAGEECEDCEIIPIYWKNGMTVQSGDIGNSINYIYVSGTDVYTWQYHKSLQKNGSPLDTGIDGGSQFAVFIQH
jgi:hypothetical protein